MIVGKVSAENLNKVMEFDHVIRVNEDGTVDDRNTGKHAPELVMELDEDGQSLYFNDEDLHEEARTSGWTLMQGHTGQHGYRGAVMHPSEFVGGSLAEYILERPGYYVTTIVECEEIHGEREEPPAGWAIAFQEL